MAQFKLIASLLVSLCLVLPLTQAKDVNYCDKKADYDVKVKAVEIIPYPVARGKPASFSISATTGESISGGKLVIEVSYFGWHIHSETHDLCSETSCPVSTGDFVIAHSQDLPGYTPPADRALVVRREKDLNVKVDSADAIRNSIDNTDSRIEELELQLQKCIIEKNDFEINMEEAVQDAGENYISLKLFGSCKN